MKLLPMLMPILCCGPVVQPAATCETFCGMRFVGEFGAADAYPMGSTGPWTCDHIQAVELGIIARFPEANDERFRDVCPKLQGWTVEMHESADWKEPGFATRLEGLTNCASRHTIIGNSPADRSALPHEMAHAVQDCHEQTDCAHPGTDDNHYCWRANGIYIAAANANLEAARRLFKDGGP